jgi:hypothetical protein
MNLFESSTGVREILLQVREGDTSAMERLFAYCLDRFRLLSKRIFNTRKDLHFFEESDDLLQDALIRLHSAVTNLKPETTRARAAYVFFFLSLLNSQGGTGLGSTHKPFLPALASASAMLNSADLEYLR